MWENEVPIVLLPVFVSFAPDVTGITSLLLAIEVSVGKSVAVSGNEVLILLSIILENRTSFITVSTVILSISTSFSSCAYGRNYISSDIGGSCCRETCSCVRK